jgi:hypothetical protein
MSLIDLAPTTLLYRQNCSVKVTEALAVGALQPRDAHRQQRRRRRFDGMSGMDVPSHPAGTVARPRSTRWRSSTSWSPTKRGLYGGAWLPQLLGDMDVAITIRTGIIRTRPYVQAAAGGWLIPVPELEWREIGWARALPGRVSWLKKVWNKA